MASLNQVTLMGNLGKDPEIRRTQDGRPIANMSIATSENWRDKSTGEKREKTDWHTVVCFNEGLCKIIEQYLHKGDTILVQGKLQTRKWQDKDGNDRWSTEVVMTAFDSKMVMVKTKRDHSGAEQGEGGSTHPGAAAGGKRDDMDDEIPF